MFVWPFLMNNAIIWYWNKYEHKNRNNAGQRDSINTFLLDSDQHIEIQEKNKINSVAVIHNKFWGAQKISMQYTVYLLLCHFVNRSDIGTNSNIWIFISLFRLQIYLDRCESIYKCLVNLTDYFRCSHFWTFTQIPVEWIWTWIHHYHVNLKGLAS